MNINIQLHKSYYKVIYPLMISEHKDIQNKSIPSIANSKLFPISANYRYDYFLTVWVTET